MPQKQISRKGDLQLGVPRRRGVITSIELCGALAFVGEEERNSKALGEVIRD